MIKNIYMLWFQGWDEAPPVCKLCLESWVHYNPDWKVHKLSLTNILNYVPKEKFDKIMKVESWTHRSDLVRIYLLANYGGLWVDATNFCNKPLKSWLKPTLFVNDCWFVMDENQNILTINFMYADKIPNLFTKCAELMIGDESLFTGKYLRMGKRINELVDHSIFEKMRGKQLVVTSNKKKLGIKCIANSHKLPLDTVDKNFISNLANNPFFKLNKGVDLTCVKPGMKMFQLVKKTFNVKMVRTVNRNYFTYYQLPIDFIHIGKCGGTTLIQHFSKNSRTLFETHFQKPREINSKHIVIWIRHPLIRFVSAFNFSLKAANYDITGLKAENVNINNCNNPFRVRKKIKTGHAFNIKYEKLLNFFGTANKLAESIYSKDDIVRKKAKQLMNSTNEHIGKNISWYLNGDKFIKQQLAAGKKIFVGRVEHFQEDYLRLIKEFNLLMPNNFKSVRVSDTKKYLSELAVSNLLKFYKDTEYHTIDVLHKNGLIDDKTVENYNKL